AVRDPAVLRRWFGRLAALPGPHAGRAHRPNHNAGAPDASARPPTQHPDRSGGCMSIQTISATDFDSAVAALSNAYSEVTVLPPRAAEPMRLQLRAATLPN